MKQTFKKIVVWKLNLCARILLLRKKPEVIAVTGSAGKTSTVRFIKEILDQDFDVLAPEEGYNTEIGAILGLFSVKTPTNIDSFWAWLKILIKVVFKAFLMRDLPSKVIIEMGADKPGDISYLCRIFKPKTGVILSVLPVHLAEFKTVYGVSKEKGELARAIPVDGKLFLNWDDEEVRKMATSTKAKVIFFGSKNIEGMIFQNVKTNLIGIEGELNYKKYHGTFAAKIYGKHLIYPLIAAIAVALEEGIPLERVLAAVKNLKPLRGRMNLIEGVNDSVIIDDTYNANPESTLRALEFLGEQKGRKIALLGSMNELGDYEKEGHEKVGVFAAKKVDLLYTVGETAKKYLVPVALKSGLKKADVKSFNNSLEAGLDLKKAIKSGDIILAKGSQNNVRLEIAVEQIMAYPEHKRELLVRQSSFWNGRQ